MEQVIEYHDSIFPWKLTVPLSGGFRGVNFACSIAKQIAKKFGFECIVTTNWNVVVLKYVTLTFYGDSTKKYAKKFQDALKESFGKLETGYNNITGE